MSGGIEIFPKALVTAARTFAKRPAVVGEVLVALVSDEGIRNEELGIRNGGRDRLTEVQRYIVAACREEMAELAARRAAAAERKRRQRNGRE